MSEQAVTGTVKFYNIDKGWGFAISDADPHRDIFIHFSHVCGDGPFVKLAQGQRIRFRVEITERGPAAREVTPL